MPRLPAVELEELHRAAERVDILEEDALATAVLLLTDRTTRPRIGEIRKLVRAVPTPGLWITPGAIIADQPGSM